MENEEAFRPMAQGSNSEAFLSGQIGIRASCPAIMFLPYPLSFVKTGIVPTC